jgi:hypothetical protein
MSELYYKLEQSGAGKNARDDAWKEYEASRSGIEKYDEHLYRIRQWSITLTAASIAAILGLSQTGNFRPSVALFGYTVICAVFWFLDAMNKSLQMVHIHVSRDIEKYLRGTSKIYIGPAISLRFHRKTKKHFVETIKNLTEQSVCLFHILPLTVIWAVVIFNGWNKLCFGFQCHLPSDRILPIVTLIVLISFILLSFIWKYGKRSGNPYSLKSRYFLRFYSAARWRLRQRIAMPSYILKGMQILPFNVDFINPETGVMLFVDRYPLAENTEYIDERRLCLERFDLAALHIDWKAVAWRFWSPAEFELDDVNQALVDRLKTTPDQYARHWADFAALFRQGPA